MLLLCSSKEAEETCYFVEFMFRRLCVQFGCLLLAAVQINCIFELNVQWVAIICIFVAVQINYILDEIISGGEAQPAGQNMRAQHFT